MSGATRRVVAGEQVDTLLDALASGATEPGSGAFAALAAASGAALVTAVAQRTLRRLSDDDPHAARLGEIAAEADAARPALLASADRDAELQDELALAARMRQDSDKRRTARLVTLQSVLEDAVDVQLDLARRSVLLAGLAEEATSVADPNAAADGLAAVAALHAAAVAALATVELNAFAIVDPARRDELTATCAALGERAASMLDDARAGFGGRVAPGST
ncbi:MAG: cyclodeaminase/cyclohydrolase family protein [Actinomycetota bacterium]